MNMSLTKTTVGSWCGLALIAACSSSVDLVPGGAEAGSAGSAGSAGTSAGGTGGSEQPDAAMGGSGGGGDIVIQPPAGGGSGGSGQIGDIGDAGLTPCVDDDGDGQCNEDDGCPAIANQDDTADLDGDGIPDECDQCAGPRVTLLAKNPLYYFPFDEAAGATEAQNLGSAGLNG